MDNEKRLRVSVDVSQLRSVGRDVENMQRRIVENNNDILRQQNDALNQQGAIEPFGTAKFRKG